MRLGWHIGLPGPFYLAGTIWRSRRRRRAVMQEYEGITAQIDGIDIDGHTVKVVIPGEAD